ncbi:RagB/SusD family nutrient uptake outer membrane protein [Zhouia sp. PK063]|uniref:RagB/SusD family nutrient uptake outer membrane protein n=1 Tax=Zhouia sp. PK063 TaxID=3373602 RepID=UPI0037A50F56
MKKIIVLVIALIFISCNNGFLDQVPDDQLTFESTFQKKETVEQYLANIYSRIPNEYAQRYPNSQNGGPWTGASDEAEYVWSFTLSNSLNIGSWDPTNGSVWYLWSSFYQGIRASSTFINNIDNCEDCGDALKKQYAAEARVLRAFFYYNIIRTYGPAVLVGDQPYDANANFSDLERNSIDDCVAYIVEQLDIAANDLKDVIMEGNEGRMNRPFALAIKEKTLLLAASPLFNGNSDYADLKDSQGQNLISQNVDVNKWKAAADAAKAFFNEFVPSTYHLYKVYNDDGSYNPYLSCREVMADEWNEEMIYERPRGDIYTYYEETPYHVGAQNEVRGSGGLGATQEMVDAFFMANGRSITDPQSGYEETGFSDFQAPGDIQSRSTFNQWVNREPRFYVDITYNNSLWLNRRYGNIITTTWYKGNSGRLAGGNDYSPTGYIARKNIPKDAPTNSISGGRAIPMLRLAELYLDYAEALNEYNPGNPEIMLYLNKIRERAGIPEYGSQNLQAPQGQVAVRDAIHKERRVELAFESVRYFDLRRWKVAEEHLNGPAHGLDINAENESDFYHVVTFENRIFENRHYLWPIPQSELSANPNLIQNTGW